MSSTIVLGMVATALLLLGLVIALVPVSSRGVDCGSTFVASKHMAVSGPTGASGRAIRQQARAEASCESLRSVLRVPAWGFLGMGALGAGTVALIAITAKPVPPPPEEQSSKPE